MNDEIHFHNGIPNDGQGYADALAPGPIRFLAESVYFGVPQLICPVCGFEYVHFETAMHADGGLYEHGWVRGEVIKIPMWCENGHRFLLEIGAHKGYAFMRYAPQWVWTDEENE